MFRPKGGFFEPAAFAATEGFGEAAQAAVASTSEAPSDGRNSPPTISDAFKIIIDLVLATPVGPEERPALAAFLSELDGMRTRIEQHLAEKTSAHVEKLSCQHAEVYAQCRAALDNLRSLQQERGRINAHLNALAVRLGDARAAFGTVQNSKPSLASFPSDDELANWYRATAVARQQFDAVETEYREAKLAAHTAANEFEAAGRDLESLTAREASLRGQLSGQAPALGTRSE